MQARGLEICADMRTIKPGAFTGTTREPYYLSMTHETPDPQAFIDAYGYDARVLVGKGREMTLGQALAAEQLLCPADEIARQDPSKRLGYLANMLAAGGSLRPEDEYLLSGGTE
jgi:hypothetical protein